MFTIPNILLPPVSFTSECCSLLSPHMAGWICWSLYQHCDLCLCSLLSHPGQMLSRSQSQLDLLFQTHPRSFIGSTDGWGVPGHLNLKQFSFCWGSFKSITQTNKIVVSISCEVKKKKEKSKRPKNYKLFISFTAQRHRSKPP